MSYNHLEFEKKWQQIWSKKNSFKANIDHKKPKYYALDMFPYPSGSGLHVGHLASYTPTDIVSRYKRAKGFNVLHPIGYDAFGLPAEQYAIQTGVHPEKTTEQAIKNFKRQLQSFGFSFDWSKEVSTCDPKFYKWTQFLFLKLFKKNLAYQKEVPVNWCPHLRTVLANEEVVNGVSERGGHAVERIAMKQWMLKITDYAERLLKDLDKLDWPQKTKEAQINWIGKSVGANIFFQIKDLQEKIEVFTTRPDTIFGVSFLVLAPEHHLVKKITQKKQQDKMNKYIKDTKKKSELERKTNENKTGVFTGSYAVHPITKKDISIWVSDYVLSGYASGAIMAVPAHDTRDFEFANLFNLKIAPIIKCDSLPTTAYMPCDRDDKTKSQYSAFEKDGELINSDFLNGMNKQNAIEKIFQYLKKHQLGVKKTQYKLRDWLFSRQRYWGEPFPIIKTSDGTLKAIDENELPVMLPLVADYQPTKNGEPPLARVKEFVNYKNKALRETDTMPGSAGSSWYFLRYTDPQNDKEPFNKEAQKYWMPVDLYIGGAEHTVGHLLYSRFWQKVFFDCGLVSHDEPFKRLAHQGIIIGTDGQKMSKSRGNVVNPDDVRKKYGADATRVYISFLGPFDKNKPWDTHGIEGVKRFLERVWRLCFDDKQNSIFDDKKLSVSIEKSLHKCIKKVSCDIESLNFNTAVSAIMILVNDLYKENCRSVFAIKPLLQLLMPFAPHIAEELWSHIGETQLISLASWPKFNEKLTQDESVTMGVQVNGKMRGTINISLQTSKEEAVEKASQINTVKKAVGKKTVVKIIYKPTKILNLIVQ